MKDINLNIELFRVEEVEFSYHRPDIDILKSFDQEQLNISIILDFAFNLEKQQFFVLCNIKYIYGNLNDGKELLNFTSENAFYIRPLKKVIKVLSDTSFDLPDAIMTPMVSVAVSTARGMIIAKTAGTFIGDYMLPMIDVNALLATYKKQSTTAIEKEKQDQQVKQTIDKTPKKKAVSKKQ
jgi:hypothetical protein